MPDENCQSAIETLQTKFFFAFHVPNIATTTGVYLSMVYITSHQKVTYMGPNIGFVCTILTYYLFHQSLVGRLAGFDTNVYPRAGVCWPLAAETSKGQYHRKAHLYDRYHCIISSKHVSLSWLVIT